MTLNTLFEQDPVLLASIQPQVMPKAPENCLYACGIIPRLRNNIADWLKLAIRLVKFSDSTWITIVGGIVIYNQMLIGG